MFWNVLDTVSIYLGTTITSSCIIKHYFLPASRSIFTQSVSAGASQTTWPCHGCSICCSICSRSNLVAWPRRVRFRPALGTAGPPSSPKAGGGHGVGDSPRANNRCMEGNRCMLKSMYPTVISHQSVCSTPSRQFPPCLHHSLVAISLRPSALPPPGPSVARSRSPLAWLLVASLLLVAIPGAPSSVLAWPSAAAASLPAPGASRRSPRRSEASPPATRFATDAGTDATMIWGNHGRLGLLEGKNSLNPKPSGGILKGFN